MQTCPAEIQLTRPPAPGHERARVGPRARAAPWCESRPGGQPACQGPQAAHERASGGQAIVTGLGIGNGLIVPAKSLCAFFVSFVIFVVGFVRRRFADSGK
jgi:hypothetical protein